MRQVRRAAEEIASHRRSGRSAGSVALAPSATASGAGHHEQIDRSRCESNTVDCRRHRQTLNSAEPTSAMSEHGTFGRFRPLARARPPSGGKISASAALSASACRTPRSARPGSARTRTHRPRITADLAQRPQPTAVTLRDHPSWRKASLARIWMVTATKGTIAPAVYHRPGYGLRPYEASHRHTGVWSGCGAGFGACGGLVRRARTLGRNGPLLKGYVMPGQKTSGATGLRICPPPPAGFVRSPPAAWTWPGTGCRCGPIPSAARPGRAVGAAGGSLPRLRAPRAPARHGDGKQESGQGNGRSEPPSPRSPGVVRLQPLRLPGDPVYRIVRHLDRSRPAVQPGPVHAC